MTRRFRAPALRELVSSASRSAGRRTVKLPLAPVVVRASGVSLSPALGFTGTGNRITVARETGAPPESTSCPRASAGAEENSGTDDQELSIGADADGVSAANVACPPPAISPSDAIPATVTRIVVFLVLAPRRRR